MSEKGGGGPYREMAADPAIKEMEKKIAAEKKGKFSIQLPEDIKEGNNIPLFDEAIKNNIKPEDIAFYSTATGILKFNSSKNVDAILDNGKKVSTKQFFYWPEKSFTYPGYFPAISIQLDTKKSRSALQWVRTLQQVKEEKERLGKIKKGDY